MRISVVGAGAMGSVYAALLASADAEVWAVDVNAQHVEAIRAGGLRAEGASGDRTVRIGATTTPDEVGQVELVVIATKAMNAEAAARSLGPLLGADTTVLTIQGLLSRLERPSAMDSARQSVARSGWPRAPDAGHERLRPAMFEGFRRMEIEVAGVRLALVQGGAGPPVLLLHGYPQTHVMWHLIATRLAERFTVVAADLRGYGDSSKPPGGPDHSEYSKRATAADQVMLMTELGFDRFAVVGHDRGGRVAHRMALDHPERVTRLAVLDIVPTYSVFESTSKEIALSTYHWFFLSQPFDLPERLIGGDPSFFLRWHLQSWSGGRADFFAPEALAEYERCFADSACIHATCEDYRAGASIDLEHDEADLGRTLACPLLVLWGKGRLDRHFDVLALWRERGQEVAGRALPTGHFLAEELPEETASELVSFLA